MSIIKVKLYNIIACVIYKITPNWNFVFLNFINKKYIVYDNDNTTKTYII